MRSTCTCICFPIPDSNYRSCQSISLFWYLPLHLPIACSLVNSSRTIVTTFLSRSIINLIDSWYADVTLRQRLRRVIPCSSQPPIGPCSPKYPATTEFHILQVAQVLHETFNCLHIVYSSLSLAESSPMDECPCINFQELVHVHCMSRKVARPSSLETGTLLSILKNDTTPYPCIEQ